MLRISLLRRKQKSFISIVLLLTIPFFIQHCSPEQTKPYDKQTVVTFAQLSLMYEKEKMTKKTTDSLYGMKVDSFFVTRGTSKEVFKKKIDLLSKDDDVWKHFLQEATKTMDSIKVAERKAMNN